jgi:hypothetical protein
LTISMSLVNLRGVPLGEDVLGGAPVVWVTGLVVPVALVTDFKVSMWCGEVIGGGGKLGTNTGGNNGILTDTSCLTDGMMAGGG